MFGIRPLNKEELEKAQSECKLGKKSSSSFHNKTNKEEDSKTLASSLLDTYCLCALENWEGKILWVFVEQASWPAWQSYGPLWRSLWRGLKLEDLPKVQNFLKATLAKIPQDHRVCFLEDGYEGPQSRVHFFPKDELPPFLSSHNSSDGASSSPNKLTVAEPPVEEAIAQSLATPGSLIPVGSWSKEELETAIKTISQAMRWTKKDPYPMASVKERAKDLGMPEQPPGFLCLLKGPNFLWVVVPHSSWRAFRQTEPSLRMVWRLYKPDDLTKIAETLCRGLLKTRHGGLTVVLEDSHFKKIWQWLPTNNRELARDTTAKENPHLTLRTTLSGYDYDKALKTLTEAKLFDVKELASQELSSLKDSYEPNLNEYKVGQGIRPLIHPKPQRTYRHVRDQDLEGFRDSIQGDFYLSRPDKEDWVDLKELLIARLPQGASEEAALNDNSLFEAYAKTSIACWERSQKILHALKFGSIIIDDGTELGRLGALKLAQFD